MRRRLATAFAALALATACGSTVGDAGPTQIDVTVGESTTTTVAPTTTESEEVTTASYRTPLALPNDAGCTPSDPQTIPPGRWYAFVYDATADSIEIDIACRFTGSQAELAASEDNTEAVDGVYVRNENTNRVELVINNGIGIPQLDEDGNDIIPAVQFYPTWFAGAEDGTAVWITIDPTRIRTITPAPKPEEDEP